MQASGLEISGVSQSFRTGFWMKRAPVLHNISFKVPARSIFGFLGANGAGKTTLIHLMVGMRAPASGTVRFEGTDCTRTEARARIGYLPERPYFHDHLTGEGLLRYFGALSGMSGKGTQARIPQVLEEVGMSHARHLELRKYSKGMLQRIGIAQAILHRPSLLVLDEPMSGLDPVGRKEMRELIIRLAGEGRTIFFSSHVIPDVEAICDQVAVIQKGKLIGCGPVSSFLSKGPVETEIAFSGITLEKAGYFSIFSSMREMPEGIRATVADENAVSEALSKILAARARVLWVNPVRPSLEDVFYES